MTNRLCTFLGGQSGPWKMTWMKCLSGEALQSVERLDIISGVPEGLPRPNTWSLRGITSNERYVQKEEKQLLITKQEGLGRPQSTCAALIPIRKNAAWWALAQDERRKIFEEQSRHIQIGLTYLPAIARRLYHCRDLGENEPFDFLTWFEFAPADESAFDQLLSELRASVEWTFVDREVEIRLCR